MADVMQGYVFPTAASIAPHLEDIPGPTTAFLASIARTLRCHVAAGLPLRLAPSELRPPTPGDPAYAGGLPDIYGRDLLAEHVGANAAVLLAPDGSLLATHRKANLYRGDVPWARPGAAFRTLALPAPLGRLTLGICMDLNPRADMDDHALADHCAREGVRVLVLLNAWLDAAEDEAAQPGGAGEGWHTLAFWAARLRPLYAPGSEPHETLVVVCNRTGTEEGACVCVSPRRCFRARALTCACVFCAGVTFAGSSALLRCTRGAGRAVVVDAMGRCEEGVRVWTL
jgi:protein N-terminal amidase